MRLHTLYSKKVLIRVACFGSAPGVRDCRANSGNGMTSHHGIMVTVVLRETQWRDRSAMAYRPLQVVRLMLASRFVCAILRNWCSCLPTLSSVRKADTGLKVCFQSDLLTSNIAHT